MKNLKRKSINKKDVLFILQNLREEDIEELKISHGNNYIQAEMNSIFNDCEAMLAVDEKTEKPIFIYGVSPLPDGKEAIIFMLSTPEIVKYTRSFFIEMTKELEEYDKRFFYLSNIIYEKNFLAKKWLKKAGFKFDNPKLCFCQVPDKFEYFYRLRKTDCKKGLN